MRPRYRLVAMLAAAFLSAPGCAVLTPSQIEAVGLFGRATESYATLPGAVIRAHAGIRGGVFQLRLRALRAVDAEVAAAAFDELVDEIEAEDDAARLAREADAALRVLDTYAQLLVQLSADEPTRQIETHAKRLSASLSDAIASYNARFAGEDDPLERLPSATAGTVRALGGLYVRRQQTLLLRGAVRNGERIVGELVPRIQAIVAPFDAFLEQELAATRDLFVKAASASGRIDAELAASVTQEIVEIRAARTLVAAARAAAARYGRAHEKLVEALERKRDLTTRIAEVRALADEVQAGLKLRKQLEN